MESPVPDFLSVLSDAEALQVLLVACPDGVIATDAGDHVVLYTGAAEMIFGFEPVDVLGQHVAMLFANRAEFDRFRRRLAREERLVNAEVAAARRDDPLFTAAISAACLQDRFGAALGAVFYVRDHTKMRAIEDTLRENNRRLHELVGTLDHVARHDQLTGLLNRGSAIERIEAFMLGAGPEHSQFGVAVLDVDHFKSVNDSYGHLVGDEVLAGVARVLRNTARQADIIGRFGGEEFIVFLPGANLEATAGFGERVRRAIAAERFRIDDDLAVSVTVSAGVASVPDCAGNLQDAIRLADDRLLQAKRAGRNRVVAFDIDEERTAA